MLPAEAIYIGSALSSRRIGVSRCDQRRGFGTGFRPADSSWAFSPAARPSPVIPRPVSGSPSGGVLLATRYRLGSRRHRPMCRPSRRSPAHAGLDRRRLPAFLADPHLRMPDMKLRRSEIDDLVSYIQSLR